jgi:hypothetical protein
MFQLIPIHMVVKPGAVLCSSYGCEIEEAYVPVKRGSINVDQVAGSNSDLRKELLKSA